MSECTKERHHCMKSSPYFLFENWYCTRRERASYYFSRVLFRLFFFFVLMFLFLFIVTLSRSLEVVFTRSYMLQFGVSSEKQPNNICFTCAQAYVEIRINEMVWCKRRDDNINRNGTQTKHTESKKKEEEYHKLKTKLQAKMCYNWIFLSKSYWYWMWDKYSDANWNLNYTNKINSAIVFKLSVCNK